MKRVCKCVATHGTNTEPPNCGNKLTTIEINNYKTTTLERTAA